MSSSAEFPPTHIGVINKKLNPPGRVSREFEDQVAQMLWGLGFEVHQRISVPIAHQVYYEVDKLCLSNEVAANDGDISETRVIWVETKLKRNGGHVGKGTLLQLWGAFNCLLYKEYDESREPDAIWVVTNGKFSRAAWNLSRAINEGLGRELFVLTDGKKLMSTQFRGT